MDKDTFDERSNSNPYGIKPTGNAFLVTDSSILNTKPLGLGKLRYISDEAILEILAFLEGVDLARVGMTSRILYVFSMANDIWRDLCLQQSSTDIKYHFTWRDTFVNNFLKSKGTTLADPARHTPIFIEGAYSNILHRMWACRNCNLKSACPGFFTTDTVARRHASTLSVEEFVREFEIPNIPVLIEGAANGWPAMHLWTKEYLIDKCKSSKFRATSGTAPLSAYFTMEEYFQYMQSSSEEVPLYLFDPKFFDTVPELCRDFAVPEYFSSSSKHGSDLFRLFGPRRRPDHRWLIAGPARSGSVFHLDPNMTNAWNISIKGRKKWIFYPPGISPPGVIASADGADVAVPLSTAEWLLSFWKEHGDALRLWPDYARPTEIIANPGDLVFVPHGYWHMVVNLDDCLAITQNYVSTSNLVDVLKFLRDKPEQISGVRERAAETVNPDIMFDEFYHLLEQSSDEHIPKNLITTALDSVRNVTIIPDSRHTSADHKKTFMLTLANRVKRDKRRQANPVDCDEDFDSRNENKKRRSAEDLVATTELRPTFSFGFNL